MARLRTTKELCEVRAWAQQRHAWPVRQLDGRVALGFRGEICRGVRIGWGEFEVNFRASRYLLVHDDTPGSTRSFVGTEREAERFVAQLAREESGAAGREARRAHA